MPEPESRRWLPVEIAGRTFERINLEHPEVGQRVVDEIESGVDVYYDRRWGLTRRFCRFLLEHPELVEERTVLIAGAGVGMEAVVAGTLARSVTVNDVAPVALSLCVEQMEHNGVSGIEVEAGPCQGVPLDGTDLVVACFMIYDAATRDAMAALLQRTGEEGIPVLLANENIGGFFTEVLEGTSRPTRDLDPDRARRFVLVE